MTKLSGRIEGKKAGDSYEIRQGKTLLRSIPMAEAMGSEKLARTIAQNKWEPL